MYCNFTKGQAFPMAFVRVSSHRIWFKPFNVSRPQASRTSSRPNLPENPICWNFRSSSSGFAEKSHINPHSRTFIKFSTESRPTALESGNGGKPRNLSYGFCLKYSSLPRARSFSSSCFLKADKGSVMVRNKKNLSRRVKVHKGNEVEKINKANVPKTGGSSWEESDKKFLQSGSMTKVDSRDSKNKLVCAVQKGKYNYIGRNEEIIEDDDDDAEVEADDDEGRVASQGKTLPWLPKTHKAKKGRKFEDAAVPKPSKSSWEKSAENFLQKGSTSTMDSKDGKRSGAMVKNWQNDRMRMDEMLEENEEVEEEETEVFEDPRWDKIKSRFMGVLDAKAVSKKPEPQRWSKQDNWGRKTWKDATESTIPKMVGEGLYGVGPVLAALSAGRREFYTLYVQEGLDLSGNNRKKKDKKRFEKVLMMADKLGISTKEATKHDLNMVVDNRPHQGLVLDASPLEMVHIKELDPVTVDEDNPPRLPKPPIWLALDEVKDPQNLGAIIRSAYFFGASGVVLCAKNSAPLSGVVSKASAGSLELIELRSCKNMMQFLAASADNGWRVLGGSVSSKAIPINDISTGAPTILVLGSEGTGLRPLVERSCTELIKIPGNFNGDATAGAVEGVGSEEMDFRPFLAVESLNVSVAAGVLLYHLFGNHSDNVCKSSDGQSNPPDLNEIR